VQVEDIHITNNQYKFENDSMSTEMKVSLKYKSKLGKETRGVAFGLFGMKNDWF